MGHIRRVVGQVQEQRDTLHTAVLLEVAREETTSLHVHTHGGEHDREVLLVSVMDVLGGLVDQTGLATDLGGNLVVRQTGGGEDGDLLTTGDGVHGVDGRDTGGDHFFRIHLVAPLAFQPLVPGTGSTGQAYPRVWVDGLTVDIQIILRQHLGALINRTTRSVKDTTQHVLRHSQLQAVPGEFDFGLVSC